MTDDAELRRLLAIAGVDTRDGSTDEAIYRSILAWHLGDCAHRLAGVIDILSALSAAQECAIEARAQNAAAQKLLTINPKSV